MILTVIVAESCSLKCASVAKHLILPPPLCRKRQIPVLNSTINMQRGQTISAVFTKSRSQKTIHCFALKKKIFLRQGVRAPALYCTVQGRLFRCWCALPSNCHTARHAASVFLVTVVRARTEHESDRHDLSIVLFSRYLPAGCREAANCQYSIYSQAKNQGRLVAPIHVKLGRVDGHVGPLGCAKFHLNRHRGWECGPKIPKMFTFWQSSPAGATPLTNLENFQGLLYAQLSYISDSNLT